MWSDEFRGGVLLGRELVGRARARDLEAPSLRAPSSAASRSRPSSSETLSHAASRRISRHIAGATIAWANSDFYHGQPFSPDGCRDARAVATMAAGFRHTCATATSGTTYCWGADDGGQLGGPAGEVCEVPGGYYYPLVDVSCSRTPLPLPNAPGAFAALTASSGTCGLLVTGEAYCWGFSRSTIPPEGRFVTLAAGFKASAASRRRSPFPVGPTPTRTRRRRRSA